MEDENGLELSLGLSCGGSSAAKNTHGNSSDVRTDEDDRGQKLINDFKSFLNGGTDPGLGLLRKDTSMPEENFFSNLSKAADDADASTNLSNGGLWVSHDNNRRTDIEEGKREEVGCKRKKLLDDDMNLKKKQEKELHRTDLHDKARTSHISITTDEGSTAENEDVADSEADASTSRPVSNRDSGHVCYIGNGGSPEVCKETQRVSDSSGVESQGHKRFTLSSENFKVNGLPYSVTFPSQSVNIMNIPYPMPVKDSNHTGTSCMSNYPSVLQVTASGSNERPVAHSLIPSSVPLMFGYSTVQLPVLDKDASQGLVPHPQQIQMPYSIRGPPNVDKQSDGLKISSGSISVLPHKASDVLQHDGRVAEQSKADGKRQAAEEGSSSKTEDDVKGNSIHLKSKDASEQPKVEGFPYEFPAIRSGIAADLKFGGCGSYPNLPWVSTTGSGPNGKTISGVTYRYTATQIRIVCACHGYHMSAEEFIQHANEDQTSADATGLASSTNGNHHPAQG